MTEEKDLTRPIDRRQFVSVAWGLTALALLGQAGVSLLRFFQPRLKVGEFGGLVNAGRVEEFPPGSVRHIQAGKFYIAHVEGDGLLAMWQRCTHLGCTVPWREEEDQFHCPCHSSLFNLPGDVTGGPAPRALDLFPVEIVDDEVIVNTGRPLVRQVYVPSQATPV